jgi:methylated-DNA-[protein]-cysteine S-methyltransferase
MSVHASTTVPSPLGTLTLIGGSGGLRQLRFSETAPVSETVGGVLGEAARQLQEYFEGRRTRFELSLALDGTPFQRWVWDQLQRIPYGATTTYGALARRLDAERPGHAVTSPRAVASAVARTPVPIVVPCHRVLGADGSLTGYIAGVHRKRALLDFEAAGGAADRLEPGTVSLQPALL